MNTDSPQSSPLFTMALRAARVRQTRTGSSSSPSKVLKTTQTRLDNGMSSLPEMPRCSPLMHLEMCSAIRSQTASRSSQDKVHLEVDVDPTEVVGDAAPLRDRDAASLKPLTTEKEPSPDSLRGGSAGISRVPVATSAARRRMLTRLRRSSAVVPTSCSTKTLQFTPEIPYLFLQLVHYLLKSSEASFHVRLR